MTEYSIPKLSTAAPSPKQPTVIVINIEDIAKTDNVITGFPTTDEGGILSTSNIVLTAGKKGYGVYATPSTINRPDSSDGDEDARGFTSTVEFDHPGDDLAFDEFIQKFINSNVVIITLGCGGSGTRLHGTPCYPMTLTFEGTDSNEATRGHLTFTQSVRSPNKSMHYVGTIPALYDNATAATPSEPEVEQSA
ncbi:MAG: hypothetical protein LBS50_06930 [Prevotellaceae bacterium]|jgi:hypothetical protein|nr:hypothetical protein [Prevotellaceae bacterium]